jgi:hypothetical protein
VTLDLRLVGLAVPDKVRVTVPADSPVRFYRVPVAVLLPGHRAPASNVTSSTKLILDLAQLRAVAADQAWLLLRFTAAIQRVRHDYGTTLLAIRTDDHRRLAAMYDTTVEGLTERMDRWQALAPHPPAPSDRSSLIPNPPDCRS